MSYEKFAAFYDGLTEDVRYDEYADYLDKVLKKYSSGAKTVLDAACGTGNITVRLAKKGYEMIGVDISADMLSAAREKECDNEILYLCQDLSELDLYGTVDAAVCTLDGVNHIEDIDTLEEIFSKISLFMNKDGLFLFDVNSLYKHREILGDNTFIYDTDDVYCVWQNFYNEDTSSVDIELDFFCPCDDGKYERYYEDFSEYYYSDKAITKALNKAGFEKEECFECLTFDRPGADTQRIFYIARKK